MPIPAIPRPTKVRVRSAETAIVGKVARWVLMVSSEQKELEGKSERGHKNLSFVVVSGCVHMG